jgi:hypothetical protein
VNKKVRSPRNKTLTISIEEKALWQNKLVSIHSPVAKEAILNRITWKREKVRQNIFCKMRFKKSWYGKLINNFY